MSASYKSSSLLVATLTCALAGCGSPEPEAGAAAAAAPAPIKSVRETDKAAAEMVTAVSAGKPGAPVDMKFDLKNRPELGKPLEVEVLVTAVSPLDKVHLTFQGTEALEVTGGGELQRSQSMPAGTGIKHTVTVVPRQEGASYVSVIALVEGAGEGSIARAFSIPVLVGDPVAEPAQKAAVATTDATGERIVSMPAQESR
jgi:hypothetical protein